ncbi:MAG: GIY-YIG nuclease family protein [Bacteroidota bacterium]
MGATKLTVEERLTYHLSNHRGYTSKAKDWIIVHSEEFECYKEALS